MVFITRWALVLNGKLLKKGKRIFSWHHWCGLIVGIFLLVMSISGSLLVFSDEIEGAYESNWTTVNNPSGAFSYDASFSNIQKLYPGWEIRLYEQPHINEALVYDLRKGTALKKIFVHPVNGSILHVSDKVQNQLHRWLLSLHYTLFAGTAGKITVFFIGILFLVSLITGIYIYRKAIVKVIFFRVRINKKSRRSLSSSLHRIIGVWTLVFNLLIVITGLFISGNITLAALKKATPAKANATGITGSIDKIKNEINQQYPSFKIHLLRVSANSNIVQLSGNFEDDPAYYGEYYSRFYFDGTNGQFQKKEWLREQGAFKKWQSMVAPLHFGNFGGLFLKFLYCLFGLMPGLLSITGFIIWRKRNKSLNQIQNRLVVASP
jgi:uncharacterized iron-regulated membrane protein